MWHGRREWELWEIEILQRLYSDVMCSPEEICSALPGRSWKAIVCRAQKYRLRRPNPHHHVICRDYFANIDSPFKAYDLGLLAADGTVLDTGAISLYLQRRDRLLVAQVRDRIAPDAPLYEYKNSCGIKIGCKEMAADLARYHITPRKSFTLRWPSLLPQAMIMPFLLGYFDGDGCLHIGNRLGAVCWSIVGTRAFLEESRRHLQDLTGLTIPEPHSAGKKSPELYVLYAYGRKAHTIDRHLNATGIGLARKHFPLGSEIAPHP